MLNSLNTIKHLWMIYNGDNAKILEAIRVHLPPIEENAEIIRALTEFNKNYVSLTIVEDDFDYLKFRLPEEILTNSKDFPVLIRWNRTPALEYFKDRLFRDYDTSVFILDDNINKYALPDWIKAFGYYVDDKAQYHIIDEHNVEILVTPFPSEVLWFAAFACKFLLIGAKGETVYNKIDAKEKEKILKVYMSEEGSSRIMAIPGRTGSLANECLKKHRYEVEFIDSWDDILEKISKKIGEKYELR